MIASSSSLRLEDLCSRLACLAAQGYMIEVNTEIERQFVGINTEIERQCGPCVVITNIEVSVSPDIIVPEQNRADQAARVNNILTIAEDEKTGATNAIWGDCVNGRVCWGTISIFGFDPDYQLDS